MFRGDVNERASEAAQEKYFSSCLRAEEFCDARSHWKFQNFKNISSSLFYFFKFICIGFRWGLASVKSVQTYEVEPTSPLR
jgi:hypothetical protein